MSDVIPNVIRYREERDHYRDRCFELRAENERLEAELEKAKSERHIEIIQPKDEMICDLEMRLEVTLREAERLRADNQLLQEAVEYYAIPNIVPSGGNLARRTLAALGGDDADRE